MNGTVAAVSREEEYRFSKRGRDAIRLVAGLGVEGDAHQGVTVRHRSRMARDPAQPNLRQVHLLHRELFAEVAEAGFEVLPGQLGENITTAGIDLLALSTGTLLRLGDEAVVEVTGLRNPCAQIDGFRDGLLKEVLGRDERGRVVRRAGIMSIVLVGGEVRPGDRIAAEAPAGPHHPLEPV
ncbi:MULTISPECIES: MOSC domain-containing protein [Streptomyces]|uniref:MOSC domain-containing protein n=2 Tax=Streptomyces TaxID=1883 RepID=A0A420UW32_9ACTN|nr:MULTISPECIES: MOSC domain-containing protein [Streptomyces]KNE81288.1 molybdenum cofactor biosysynthesis protein [Streptomyces fradiae]OFA57852.1 molybdenum cofactor biosysynthesis protein [Streptomyces fradiae]PQM23683.1 MOSC domain-containing protein [Streptomyces xinghaiensis]RKM91671.1 MOSC domain-containing protein [Streptomyces xinghaiensis]RNC73376.1 MOSC domain-containing protein [Streptomyces xinghaiensis]